MHLLPHSDIDSSLCATGVDRTISTGVGGGRWYRFAGTGGDSLLLVPSPVLVSGSGGTCGTGHAGWLSGWTGTGSPPADYGEPGRYPSAAEGVVDMTVCSPTGVSGNWRPCGVHTTVGVVQCQGFLLWRLPYALDDATVCPGAVGSGHTSLSARAYCTAPTVLHLAAYCAPLSGFCRGPGGDQDFVAGKWNQQHVAHQHLRKIPSQQECAAQCDTEPTCVGYDYDLSRGYCSVYGPNMAQGARPPFQAITDHHGRLATTVTIAGADRTGLSTPFAVVCYRRAASNTCTHPPPPPAPGGHAVAPGGGDPEGPTPTPTPTPTPKVG
jgi:hypothetical protein